MICLCERLSFDQLFRISDPKRVYRSFTVRGPPLEIDSYQDAVYYIFNFKANPSTTGLRHRGYIKFFKPKNKNPKDVPLQHLECMVDCECPDFRYMWAWANKQRQSSAVGPNSLNQAWNKAPRIKNPSGRPGLCKHILAARAYIYGLMSSFEGDEPDTAYKLDRLTKHATKRWTDFEGYMAAAKAKEQEIRRRREQRNLGQLPTTPIGKPLPVRKGPQPPEATAPGVVPPEKKPKSTKDLTKVGPEPLPLAVPPGQRGRNLPPAKKGPTPPLPLAVPPGQRGRTMPTGKPITKPKRVIGNRKIKPLESRGWIRSNDAHLILESVVNANSDNMSNIQEAVKLVREMIDDEEDRLGSETGAPPVDLDGMGPIDGGGMGGEGMGGELEPSEPPISDTAIGADTEGVTALSLLKSIDTSLQQIAMAVAPPELGAEEAGMQGGPEGAPEGGGEIPMPDEPPADIEAEAAAEGEEAGEEAAEFEAGEEAGEEEEAERKPKKKTEEE